MIAKKLQNLWSENMSYPLQVNGSSRCDEASYDDIRPKLRQNWQLCLIRQVVLVSSLERLAKWRFATLHVKIGVFLEI